MADKSALPTADELMEKIALAEAEKADAAAKKRAEADAEKQMLLEKFTKPSGVSEDERMQRAAAIIQRAASNGLTEVLIAKFPNALFTDHGRAINQQEAGWENTLTGLPKELFEFWKKHLQPRGYKIKYEIVNFPNGMPGDVGITLSWS